MQSDDVGQYSDSRTDSKHSVDAATVGVSRQHDDHLRFLYEGNDKFAVLPTYAVIPATMAIFPSLLSGNIQGFHFNPAMVWVFNSICLTFHLFLQFTLK